MSRRLSLMTVGMIWLLSACGGSEGAELARAGRLVVASADSGRLLVLDLRDGEVAAELEAASVSQLFAGAGERFAFVFADEGVGLLDGGVRYTRHGSHFHLNFHEPRLDRSALTPPLPAARPSGFAHHDDRAAFFFEGSGELDEPASVWVVHEDALWLGEPSPSEFELEGPHRGVGVPLGSGLLATGDLEEQSPGELRASGLVHLDAAGEVSETIEEACALLPLHAALGDGRFAFGCEDGLLFVESSGALSASHVGELGAPLRLAADPRGAGAFVSLSPSSLEWIGLGGEPRRTLELEAELVDLVPLRDEEGEGARLAALTADGAVHFVEPVSFELESAPGVIAPLAPGEGEARLAAARGALYVSSPSSDEVLELDLHGDVLRRFPIPFSPGSLVVLGPGHPLDPSETDYDH